MVFVIFYTGLSHKSPLFPNGKNHKKLVPWRGVLEKFKFQTPEKHPMKVKRVIGNIGEIFRCSLCIDLVEQAVTLRSCEQKVIRPGGTLRCPDYGIQFSSPDIIQPSRILSTNLDF